jgi:hypothetical protein
VFRLWRCHDQKHVISTGERSKVTARGRSHPASFYFTPGSFIHCLKSRRTSPEDKMKCLSGREGSVDLFSDAAKATRNARRNTARTFLVEGWLPYATSA